MTDYKPATEEEMKRWEQDILRFPDKPRDFLQRRLLRLIATMRERDARWEKLKERITQYADPLRDLNNANSLWPYMDNDMLLSWMAELEKEQANA